MPEILRYCVRFSFCVIDPAFILLLRFYPVLKLTEKRQFAYEL